MANWTPTLLGSRLFAWYDSSDTTTLTASGSTSGSTVTQWRDKSGNARHLSNTRGNGLPIIDTTSFNSKNSIRFQNAFVQSVNLNYNISQVSMHTSTMRRFTNNQDDYRLLSFAASGYFDDQIPGTFYVGTYGSSATTTAFGFHTLQNGQSDATTSMGPQEQQGAIVNTVFDGTNITTYVNGNSGTSVAQKTSATTVNYMSVGANVYGGDQTQPYYHGITDENFGEIVLVNGAITTAERQQIEGYLAWNWGTVSYLPSNHPYKSAAPTDGTSSGSSGNNVTRAWLPTDLGTALTEWWDSGSGISLNGSTVASWTGKYAGLVLTGASGSQPGYSTSARNSKPGLTFNGSTSVTLTDNNYLPKTDFSFSVSAYNSGGTNATYLAGWGSSANTGAGRGILKTGSNYINFDYYGNSFGGSPAVTTDFFTMTNYKSATPLTTLYLDGSQTATYGTALVASTGNSTFAVGYWPLYGSNFVGTIQQVVITNRSLTDTERQLLEGWESWYTAKNGANLPSGHPYKSAAPTVTSGSPWTPANLNSQPYAWYDANDTSTMTKDASNLVSQWNDKSGNNRHITQTNSTYRPTYSATSLQGVSKPALYFNNDGMYNTSFGFTGTVATGFVVTSIVSAGAGNNYGRIISFADAAQNPDYNSVDGASIIGGQTGNICSYANNQQRGTAIAISYNSAAIWQGGVNGTTTNLFMNGTGTAQTTGHSTINFNSTRLGIGTHGDSNATAVNEPCNAYISEVLILNYYPSDSDRQLIEGYLAWKWGLQGSLPSNHPYKTAAPTNAVSISYTAWNPSNLNINPIKWFDANDNTTITQSSGSVSSWANKGTEPGNATMVSANQPTYNSTAFNKFPGIVFNGSQYLSAAIALSNPYVSVFMAGYQTTAKNHARAVSLHGTGGTATDYDYNVEGNVAIVKASANQSYLPQIERNGSVVDGPTVMYNNPGFVNHGFDGTNGYLLSNGSTTSTTFAKATTLTAQLIQIGGWQDGSTAPNDGWIGPISEVIVLNYTPTLAERQRIEGYLAWKWQITSVLPTNHPYKNAAPLAPSAVTYTDFTPWQIRSATLSGWYSASDQNTLTLNGSGVSQWRDKSGKGRHLNQSNTTYQPVYSSTSQNGYPGITSSGTQFMKTSTGMAYPAQPTSIFILGTAAPNTLNTPRLISLAPSGGNDRSTGGVSLTGQSAGAGALQYFFSGSYVSYCYFPVGPISIMEGYAISTTQATAVIDAGNYTNSGSYTNISGQVALDLMALFSTTDGTGGWPGTISEVIIVSGVLSTAEVQKIEGYLAWVNQQQGMLPANNTYRATRPQLPFYRRRSFSIMC